MREKAEAEKRPLRYDGTWRDRDPAKAPAGVKPAIRFKAPQDGETVIEDHVMGRVVFQNKELDDLIILRSDGNPTYNLSVVVDDHDMGVTHIIRGVDHLTNAARQTQIYKAMGWPVPDMAHIPLIHGPDGAKLSKRHGALGVEAYRPWAICPRRCATIWRASAGAMATTRSSRPSRWSRGSSFEGIGKSPSRFDFVKLENLNGHYMRSTPDDETARGLPRLPAACRRRPRDAGAHRCAHAGQAHPRDAGSQGARQDTSRSDEECAVSVRSRPLTLDDKARQIMADGGIAALQELLPVLSGAEWNAADLEAAVKAHAEATGAKLGKLAQPLRAALTGTNTSPGIFDVLDVLGRESR